MLPVMSTIAETFRNSYTFRIPQNVKDKDYPITCHDGTGEE
jgi:hypothetical protein